MINWEKLSAEDMLSIARICNRAGERYPDVSKMDLSMDITVAHISGCPLDLSKLEAFDDFNFYHDVDGIRAYLDRHTGELTNCFLPRCSQSCEA